MAFITCELRPRSHCDEPDGPTLKILGVTFHHVGPAKYASYEESGRWSSLHCRWLFKHRQKQGGNPRKNEIIRASSVCIFLDNHTRL